MAYFTASCDDFETNTRFAKSLDLDYPILSDPNGEVARKYGVLTAAGRPSRWTFYIGRDGKILDIDKSVKAAQEGTNCAIKLQSLGVAQKQD